MHRIVGFFFILIVTFGVAPIAFGQHRENDIIFTGGDKSSAHEFFDILAKVTGAAVREDHGEDLTHVGIAPFFAFRDPGDEPFYVININDVPESRYKVARDLTGREITFNGAIAEKLFNILTGAGIHTLVINRDTFIETPSFFCRSTEVLTPTFYSCRLKTFGETHR